MRREEKLRETMVRYLEGSLDAEEVAKLNQAVEYDWAARHEMAELMLQETLLGRIGQESEFFELDAPKAETPRRTTSRHNTTTRIMRSIDAPLARPAANPRIRGVVAVAAAAFFAVSVAFAVKGLTPAAPEIPIDAVIISLPEPAPEAVKPLPPPEPPPTMKAKGETTVPRTPAVRPPAKAHTVRKAPPTAPAVMPDPAPPRPGVPDGIMIQPAPEIPPPLPPKK